MSVIIKDMGMPNCCRGCVMYDTMSCRVLHRDVYRHAAVTADRPEDCPLRPAPEWVSVEERLPDHTRTVLGVNNAGCFFIACFSSGSWQYIPEEIHITHWMPLPEPPKEEI